ncbi:hypothetical protein ACFO4P_05090 [Epilithonimonas pallida]|uniref:Receptor L domain-containing protein n=1 Tax=Epilithonimonas pallida TaxID=373671 RepID=A0ABY1R2H5_9FLAO|nr:hypothetical protein [Epilithonimonas pallida]SMP90044.1 hypothetical protein SAMN05421679_102171 [Epilithonimonas pallida]
MNVIEQYDANNVYYPISVNNCTQIQKLYFGTIDENIYKSKSDWGDGTSNNVISTSNYSAKNYSNNYTGKIKIYSNPKKVKEIIFDLGISNLGTETNPLGYIKNVDLTPDILDFFPNCEKLLFNHYCYGSGDLSFQGKVIGEWATKCGNKLKNLELRNNDYPQSNPTFDLNLIPSNSVLESLYLGSGYAVNNSFVNVSGSLNNLPSSCKIIYLGNDKTGTTNSVSGNISPSVEELSRLGRNTISGNINTFSSNFRYLYLLGSNTVSGVLPSFPYLTYINLGGNNTISGNLINISTAGTISITGMNTISGNIPNLPNTTLLTINGSNNLTGSVPVLNSITQFTVNGNNTLNGVLNLPNATLITVGGQNTITALNLPKSNGVVISGQNKITGDLFTQINSATSNIQIGGENTISSISGVFSNCSTFSIGGQNTISGDILSKCPNANSIVIAGNNTMNAYNSKTYPSNMGTLDITGLATLSSTMVDQILIDLARDVTNWSGSKRITLKGNCQPPSSASAAARANLTSAPKNVTLLTN